MVNFGAKVLASNLSCESCLLEDISARPVGFGMNLISFYE